MLMRKCRCLISYKHICFYVSSPRLLSSVTFNLFQKQARRDSLTERKENVIPTEIVPVCNMKGVSVSVRYIPDYNIILNLIVHDTILSRM